MSSSVSPGLAWMVIPRTRSFFSLGSLDFQSWRMFVALCSIPSLTSALIFIFMPESPKFLLEVFKKMSVWYLKQVVLQCLLSGFCPFFVRLLVKKRRFGSFKRCSG